jgi:hypothetical protein
MSGWPIPELKRESHPVFAGLVAVVGLVAVFFVTRLAVRVRRRLPGAEPSIKRGAAAFVLIPYAFGGAFVIVSIAALATITRATYELLIIPIVVALLLFFVTGGAAFLTYRVYERKNAFKDWLAEI